MEEPKPVEGDTQTVFVVKESDVAKTKVSQCQMGNHKWRKYSDDELACIICPTVTRFESAEIAKQELDKQA